MPGNIFLIQPDGELVPMEEQRYDSEDLLQRLLELYPDLLAGDQMHPTQPRRWLLIAREMGVPSEEEGYERWALDHLFLDQDATPTLVEVKRSTDTRIRREVVGQMLDYAANTVAYWPIERVISQFERTCEARKQDPEVVLEGFLPEDADPAVFWESAKTNLQAGKVRLVFVADKIPRELQRIVEFLNAQMRTAEVLAVEIKQFVGPDQKTLVPRVIGRTAQADATKSEGSGGRTRVDRETFLNTLAEERSSQEAQVVRRIFEWAAGRRIRSLAGAASFTFHLRYGQANYNPIVIHVSGTIQLRSYYLKERTPLFADRSALEELLRRFGELPQASIPPEGWPQPSVDISALRDADALERFIALLDWYVDFVAEREAESGHAPGSPGGP